MTARTPTATDRTPRSKRCRGDLREALRPKPRVPQPSASARARALLGLSAVLAVFGAGQVAPGPDEPEPHAIRFTHCDVVVDSNDKPLAAYQVELTCSSPNVTLVGVEGGEHAAFKEPPYYDPAALHSPRGARIILGAFSTGADLPAGKTRVARIHVQVGGEGAPDFTTKLTVAAAGDGSQVPATVTLTAGHP